MKRLIGCALLILLTSSVFSQELPNLQQPVFKTGEVLRYRVRYGLITAGDASLKVENSDVKFTNRPVYRLVAQGKTSGPFDLFKKIRNRYDSYIDRKNLTPYLYTENVREGNYIRNDKARFYQDERKVVSNEGTYKGNMQTFDIVSAYYFARNLDLSGIKPGKIFTLSYFLNDGVSELGIQYIGKERIKTSSGFVNCLKFSPAIKPGRIFRKDSKLYLWITDDNNRVPVKALAELRVGSATMELISAKGLKEPAIYAKN
ncbi:MAG TPA: DUF3108 domain-containing protein [Sphingobacteriaceae bacterium]|nr:DUF3108 domain-containing protein [Sphingobacteriaceae bacterium]